MDEVAFLYETANELRALAERTPQIASELRRMADGLERDADELRRQSAAES